MKVYYASDLHLEMSWCRNEFVKKKHDILILAGDILTYKLLKKYPEETDHFMQRCVDGHKAVFFYPGNHEYYGGTIEEMDAILRSRYPSIHHLDQFNHYVIDDNTVIVGGTLWTDFDKGNPIAMDLADRSMNDYYLIGGFTPEKSIALHQQFLANINSVCEKYKDKTVIVATHHAPTYRSVNPIHSGNGLDPAFASDLSEFILDRPNIKFWIHGHTHIQTMYMVGNCIVMSNCRGYTSERIYREFKFNKFFELL